MIKNQAFQTILKSMKKNTFSLLFLCFYCISANATPPVVYGPPLGFITTSPQGFITLNGNVIGLPQLLALGYPNAINQQMEGPRLGCIDGDDSVQDRDSAHPRPPLKVAEAKKETFDTKSTMSEEDYQAALASKIELENQLSTANNTFEDPDNFFKSITTEPPPNCQYKLKGFTQAEVQKICNAMDDIAKDLPVRESSRCHVSNCTTASYLAVIKIAKSRPDWENIKSKFTCRSPFPAAYRLFGGANGLRAFVAENDLGKTQRLVLQGNSDRRSKKLQDDFAAGWPRKNDPILLQRNASKDLTAHSVIFSHYTTESGADYDPKQPEKITQVCYWSSNYGTKGTSNRCEPISYMDFIDAAQIK